MTKNLACPARFFVAIILLCIALAGCQISHTTPTLTRILPSPTITPIVVEYTIANTPTQRITATSENNSTPHPAEFVWKLSGDPNPFNAPVGVAIDAQGNIYVLDTKNARVQKFDRDGKFLLMWGSPGNGDGQFSINLPDEGRLAIDSRGDVYVIDVSNFRIQKFDSQGNYLTQWGSRGDGDSQFLEPADIAIDEQDNIYVVDYQNYHIQKFGKNGKLLLRWGSAAQFANIGSVAIDSEGNVLVCDESSRIRKFDSNGKLISTIPPQSFDNSPIDTWNIAVDDQGDIYVADHGSYRIVKLDSQGKVIATWRGAQAGGVMFDSLEDITVDKQGNVYITDSSSNLVQKFRQSAFTLAPVIPSPTMTPVIPSSTRTPVLLSSTQAPVLPSLSPTLTRTSEPSVQAQSLQEMAGDWKSPRTLCAGSPCLLRFKADGTFEIWSLFQGVPDMLI